MQALVVLDDLRSMTRAAQAMGMSQPAMTQLVAELEQLLEVTLFLRHSRGIEPTAVARDLLPVARRILNATEEGAQSIATRIRRDSGPVRIAGTVAGLGALLHPALPELAKSLEEVNVHVETVIGQSLSASFTSDEFDLILCRRQAVVPEGWQFVACTDDHAVIVAGKRHPLAAKVTVSAAELGEARWLQNHVATLARQAFDDLCQRHGWTDIQEVQVISRLPQMIWGMLESGELLCLTPRTVVRPWTANGSLLELPFDVHRPLEPVGYYWKPKTAHGLTVGFTRIIQSFAKETSTDTIR